MPKNCSKDIDLVVNYLDKILMNPYTSNSKKDSIKDRFGLKGLRDDDFMGYENAIICSRSLI